MYGSTIFAFVANSFVQVPPFDLDAVSIFKTSIPPSVLSTIAMAITSLPNHGSTPYDIYWQDFPLLSCLVFMPVLLWILPVGLGGSNVLYAARALNFTACVEYFCLPGFLLVIDDNKLFDVLLHHERRNQRALYGSPPFQLNLHTLKLSPSEPWLFVACLIGTTRPNMPIGGLATLCAMCPSDHGFALHFHHYVKCAHLAPKSRFILNTVVHSIPSGWPLHFIMTAMSCLICPFGSAFTFHCGPLRSLSLIEIYIDLYPLVYPGNLRDSMIFLPIAHDRWIGLLS